MAADRQPDPPVTTGDPRSREVADDRSRVTGDDPESTVTVGRPGVGPADLDSGTGDQGLPGGDAEPGMTRSHPGDVPGLGALPALRRVGPVAGFVAGAAASIFATAVAAGVAGFQANRNLQPIEFTIRVGLLLAAPCMGAVLATLVLPRRRGPRPAWAIGAGVAIGPLLVLRMDRLLGYGLLPAVAGVAALAAWVLAGAAVARDTSTRPDRDVERSQLPPGPPESSGVQQSVAPGRPGGDH